MKRLIMLFATASVLFTACKLENGSTSGHTYSRMESYTYSMFNANVIRPAAEINLLIELDRYIKATPEELQSDEFAWHRKNFFHEDDVTFNVRGLGTVYTYGKSFFDEGAAWKTNLVCERVGDKSWKLTSGPYDEYNIHTTVTFEGHNGEGQNVFKVEAQTMDECLTSYPDGDKITGIISTPEGPMTIIAPQIINYYEIQQVELPQGSGVFKIETQRNGDLLDIMELLYAPSGKSVIFSYFSHKSAQ